MLRTISNTAALIAVFVERYVLSLIFLYFAWIEFRTILYFTGNDFQLLRPLWVEPPLTQGILLAEIAHHVIMLVLNFFTGLLLLLGCRPSVLPKRSKDIVVPLVTSFFVLTYDAARFLPTPIQKSLCPQSWQIPLIFIGLLLGVIGPALATWAILYLRRSFGILVVVRKVVLGGPYQWIRHPMYLGYICVLIGLVLTNFSAMYFVLVPVHIGLLVYRAKLEESRLCENSAEYRGYRNRSGFILPRFRRHTGDLLKIE